MKIVGFSFGYHDSSVAFIENNKVLAVIPEERITRQKHDPNLPINAFYDGMSYLGWKTSDIDKIVLHEDSYNKFSRVLTSSISGFPNTRLEFVESMKSWLSEKLWAPFNVAKEVSFPVEKIEYLGHHFSHSVQGFMGSGFEEATILVIDAVGDWACSGIYQGKWEDSKPNVTCLEEISFPNSLGLAYSAITGFLGFSPNDNECSVMALASFGKPTYYNEMCDIIKIEKVGRYSIDTDYFHFVKFYSGAVTKKFQKIFGNERKFNHKLNVSSFEVTDYEKLDADTKRYLDIACSLQKRIEEAIIALSKYAKEKFPSKNLCLTGGVSLNCVANKKLLDENIFENIYIPIEPGDCGTSFGCALYVNAQEQASDPKESINSAYLGLSYDHEKTLEISQYLKSPQFNKYIMSEATEQKYKLETQVIEDKQELAKMLSENVYEGKIIGIYQGRSELGPRALGNRSIICRADDQEIALKLSHKIKRRAAYRPYALSMTKEDAEVLLNTNKDLLNFKWMQYSCDVNPSFYEEVKYGCHTDQSTRPQVVTEQDNPLFSLILKHSSSKGLKALINTSFNPSGYPIVEHPSHAFAMFLRTDMDILLINDTIIKKVDL
ncbi:carbamoyltransferase N-terminal domain-containing protein [Bacteriovoracaceae bacterium]|nr:carbamoyltransferase N-terminal domain-containing protein [Bacteriovoracaceae bacterium]